MEVFATVRRALVLREERAQVPGARKKRIHGLMGLAKKLRIVYKPLGVVGLITPWNGPFALAVNPTVQALMAGNTVVHKPSEVTPFSTASCCARCSRRPVCPTAFYQLVQGDGQPARR
jgi:acyl-CoA reductase-like NAD-dependent aldehyde dehydrogenase